MGQTDTANDLKRRLPSVDAVLKHLSDLIELRGHAQVTKVTRSEIDHLRQQIDAGAQPSISIDVIKASLVKQLAEKISHRLKP